ncbi:MAG: helix-turn-helix domain-containing protein, partial [Vicinamibacterales bacterium]
FRKIIEEMETRLILRALEVSGGVQKRAAELLQIKPTTLNEMLKRYGIPTRRTRISEDRKKELTDQTNGNVDSANSNISDAINEQLTKH